MNKETTIKAADPLRIWNAVSKTDPRHTKPVEFGRKFTAIDAHYQIQEATRQFGPIGEGWGYDTGEIVFEDGLVIVPLTLWHGSRDKSFGPIYGSTTMRDSKGKIDKDAPKKATTDALTKALSQLGFNADVFLGRFDDNKYVENLRREFEAEGNGKVEGIAKIKTRLNKLMIDGNAETDLDAFNALVHDCKDELTKIRDAKHQYWTGDGEDSEGFVAWIKRRREELVGQEESTAFQFLMSLLDECDTPAALQNLVAKHGDAIDALDGEESRRFQARFDEREAGLHAVEVIRA
jgi:hypothetical protein